MNFGHVSTEMVRDSRPNITQMSKEEGIQKCVNRNLKLKYLNGDRC